MNEPSHPELAAAKSALMELLRRRSNQARFLTEVYASMERLKIGKEETDRTLAELQSEGALMVRDNFCADPHLARVDLRLVALVEGVGGADPQWSAIRAIDEAWNKWLGEYLATHRCG